PVSRRLLRHADHRLRTRRVPRLRRKQLRPLRLRVPGVERMRLVPKSKRWRGALVASAVVGVAVGLFAAFATAHEPRDANRDGLSAGVSAIHALPVATSLPPDVARWVEQSARDIGNDPDRAK